MSARHLAGRAERVRKTSMSGVPSVSRAVLCDGRDIRAFVVGGEILGAVMRIGRRSGHASVTEGVCVPYELSAYSGSYCLQAASDRPRVLGIDFSQAQWAFSEVNGAPQWHGLAAATGSR